MELGDLRRARALLQWAATGTAPFVGMRNASPAETRRALALISGTCDHDADCNCSAPASAARVGADAGSLTPLTEREVMLVASNTGKQWGDTHGNIDVHAQRSIVRLSKNPATAADGHGLLEAVRARELRGIFIEDQQVPALRARRWGKGYWEVIPKGEDAALLLDPDAPATGPPLIMFRDSIKNDAVRLDTALVKAHRAFRGMRQPGVMPCGPVSAGATSDIAAGQAPAGGVALPFLNIVPQNVLCQIPTPTLALAQLELHSRRSGGGNAPICKFTVTHAPDATGRVKQTKQGKTARFDVPAGPVSIHIQPITFPATLWDITGAFLLTPDGRLLKKKSSSEDEAHFRVTRTSPTAFRVEAFVSRLKIVTQKARAHDPEWRNPISATPPIHFIAHDVLVNKKLVFDITTSQPKTEEEVFQLRGLKAPKLIAVSWPKLPPAPDGRKSFFVFYPPHETIPAGSDPFTFGIIRAGFTQYLRYPEDGGIPRDPLTSIGGANPAGMGMPYQIDRAGKNVALVIPLPSRTAQFDQFVIAAFVHQTLKDIQAFMLRLLARRAGRGFPVQPADVGPVALGGWSEGNTPVGFLLQNPKSPFMKDVVREVYGIDPIGKGMPAETWKDVAFKWQGTSTTKVVRFYLNGNVKAGTPDVAEFERTKKAPFSTRAHIGDNVWKAAGGVRSSHGSHPAFFLTDAIRTSKAF